MHSFHQRQKLSEELRLEVEKVKGGDGDAAGGLSNYYHFYQGDFTAAYFWAVQARKLNEPNFTDEMVDQIEAGVFSALTTNKASANEIIYDELPPIEP
jgi:hypothetical protein